MERFRLYGLFNRLLAVSSRLYGKRINYRFYKGKLVALINRKSLLARLPYLRGKTRKRYMRTT